MRKQQLASLIWSACDDLRGSISAVEYKDIILGLIFYRFLCEREVAELRAQRWTDEDLKCDLNENNTRTVKWCQDTFGCFISYDYLFSTWVDNPGAFAAAKLVEALSFFTRNISSKPEYQKLYKEIFKSLSEKLTKLGGAGDQTAKLKKVFDVIQLIPMDNRQGYDVLGFIYEFLLKNFASSSKKDGEFYTPHEISLLMSEIVAYHLRDREQINILDPTSGSASLLVNIGQSIQKYLDEDSNITYYAQELIQETYNLTRMNLMMRGIKPANIKVRQGDTLATDWPYFEDDPNDYRYVPVDCVVSNPPYSQKWDAAHYSSDPRYRDYGIAPSGKADLAFLLHDLYHLRDDGIMCIVMPHGVLFRGGSEEEIRKALVQNNNIETIIGLPANCFYGTGIATLILVLKKHREADDILIIDASSEFYKDGNKNRLAGKNIRRIMDVILSRQEVPHFSKLVSKSDVIANGYNLNIPRYVAPKEKPPFDPYATVFGGIPTCEIDSLKKDWDAFPSLRIQLFTPINDHVSSLSSKNVRKTVHGNPDVKAFELAYQNAFQQMEAELINLLIDSPITNVSSLHHEISSRLFQYCQSFDVVNPYQVYQIFDEAWGTISIDLELLSTQGISACRDLEELKEYNKEEKKVLTTGVEGKVIPFTMIQRFLFSDDFAELQELIMSLGDRQSEFESLWIESDDEFKESLKKEKDDADGEAEPELDSSRLKEQYKKLMDSLDNVQSLQYAAYLNMSAKEKLSFQSSHPELIWPSAADKMKNGTFKASAIKTLAQKAKQEIELPEGSDESKIRKLFELSQEISSLKKQQKEKIALLDEKASTALPVLSEEEIKMLLHEKWITPILSKINNFPAQLERELCSQVEALRSRYSNPLSDIAPEIVTVEQTLSSELNNLTGNEFDMAAIRTMSALLGGAFNE